MNAIDVLTAGELAVEYPESDGKPMAETGIHVDCMTDLFKMLRGFFLMVMKQDVSLPLLPGGHPLDGGLRGQVQVSPGTVVN